MLQYASPAQEEWRRSADPIRTFALRDDLEGLRDRLVDLGILDAASAGFDDVDEAQELLDQAFTGATEALAAGHASAGDHAALVDLMLELRELNARLRGEREAGRVAALGRVREATGLLRGVSTVEQMMERGPVAAAHLGFDRTFVSSIKDACFVPYSCFVGGDTEWAKAIVRAGQEQPRKLDRRLLETEMVRRRQPLRVLDAQNDPRVHQEIAKVSMSRSYVAAPIVVQDRVIGFVHADFFFAKRLVRTSDAELLWMFAEAFGSAFERIAAGEQLRVMRRTFQRAMAETDATFAHICDRELSFESTIATEPARPEGPLPIAGTPPVPAGAPVPTELADLLTKRELEVLRLMAEGATNDGIAQRLVISHGTAKTHVKHILRKLRAANRAEAVSRFFQLRGEH
jgi:DNA-binding CsgD family transcriptional regulator/GAF domain-containing protein